MKKIIAIIAIAFAAVAGSVHAETAIGMEPVYETTAHQECTNAPASGGWFGQALGGVIGAGLGSQVGKGSGQAAAAAAGAVLGAQVGAATSANQPAGQNCRQIVDRNHTGFMVRTDRGTQIFVPAYMMPRR